MTENKQLERERNWVKARFDCNVDAVFEELVAVIESDIGVFNKLSGKDDCAVRHIRDGKVTFSRDKRVISISTDGKTITVEFMHGDCRLSSDFTIKSKWNPVEMHCDFVYRQRQGVHAFRQSGDHRRRAVFMRRNADMAIGKEPWTIPAGSHKETDQEVEVVELDFTGGGFIIELRFKSEQGRSASVRAPLTRDAVERLLELLPAAAEWISR